MADEKIKGKSLTTFGPAGENLSIIIPTYNCARYLAKTLLSIRSEVEGTLNRAQIVVVDDCSTKDDPEEVVGETWGEKVRFIRHPRNLGPCANFNACLDLAEGEWIHLVHGDDYVLPGAYRGFAEVIRKYPDSIAVFARSEIVASDGKFICRSASLGPEEYGRLTYDPRSWRQNSIYPAGVLLSQRSLREVGKFDCSFAHVQDWNLWWRLARTGRCAYSSNCLGGYREVKGSHGSSLRPTAENLKEASEQIRRLLVSLEQDPQWSELDRDYFHEGMYGMAFHQCTAFLGKRRPFAASWFYLRNLPPPVRRKHKQEMRNLRTSHLSEMLRQLGARFRRIGS